jgi:hypothetical protein
MKKKSMLKKKKKKGGGGVAIRGIQILSSTITFACG